MRLLFVDDDKDLTSFVKDGFKDSFIFESAANGEDGEYKALINHYDIIILDMVLPDVNGLKVCKNLRTEGVKTPIIILTGEESLEKKVEAFDGGADDYLTKPFEFGELKARVGALLRRYSDVSAEKTISIADLKIDPGKRLVIRGGKLISLRRKEFDLLEYLVTNVGKVVTREMVLDHLWDSGYESLSNTVDVHIKYLRDKVDRDFGRELIKTVHGLGYKIEV